MHTAIVAVVCVALILGWAGIAHLFRFKGEYEDKGL